MDNQTCTNCGQALRGAFCAACGQRALDRLTFGSLLRESVLRVFDVDRGILHTFVALSTRPGRAIRLYIGGQRLRLIHPVSYCFVLVTVYALAVNLMDVQVSIPGVERFDEVELRVYRVIHAILAYLMFLIIWPVAVLQARLFRPSGFSIAETYAFCLYVYGHATLISAVFAVAGWLTGIAGVGVLIAIQFAYVVWAMTGFYELSRPPVLRGLLLVSLNLVIANAVSVLIGNLIVAAGLLEPLESLVA